MPSARAAAVVSSLGLDDMDAARRSRERVAARHKAVNPKITLASLPKTLHLDRANLDATAQRIAQARVNGEVIGKLGEARHFASPFQTLAKKRFLNPGDSKAAIDLNEALFAAGQRYAEAFEGAHMGVLRSVAFTDVVSRSTAPQVTDHGSHVVACRKRVDEVREVIGLRLMGLVDAVVLEGRTLTDVARQYGVSKDLRLAQTEVRVMLVEALHQLVRYWRMYNYRAIGEAA